MSALSGLSPYLVAPTIAGGLNVGNAGANMFAGAGNLVSNPTAAINQLGTNYAAQYNNALSANQANYAQTLAGYQTTAAKQTTAEQAISGGYNQLYNTVLGTLGVGQGGAVGNGGMVNQNGNWGIAGPAAQAIADTYAQQQGSVLQNAVNSGIGGTSALANLQRGPSLDAAKAYGALGSQLAQTAAGYESQLGQAGLNYANQAVNQNTALANEQLKFMAGVQIPYPSAQAYGSLISGGLGVQAAQAARARAGAGGGGAVVNPFGSASAGSQGHTPFISGSTPSPNILPPPSTATGQMQGTRAANPQTINNPGSGYYVPPNWEELLGGDSSPALNTNAANTVAGGASAQSLANTYSQDQMQYTTDASGNPQLVDDQGNYYDPSTGEWIGNQAFDSSGGFDAGSA